ncbi:hypothetical protein Peur_021536 [Populus x canadensis]
MASPTSVPLFQQPRSVRWILFETLTGFWSEASNDGGFASSSVAPLFDELDDSTCLLGQVQCCALVAVAGFAIAEVLLVAAICSLAFSSIAYTIGDCRTLSLTCSLGEGLSPIAWTTDVVFSIAALLIRASGDDVRMVHYSCVACWFAFLVAAICSLVELLDCCCHPEVELFSVVHRGALVYCKASPLQASLLLYTFFMAKNKCNTRRPSVQNQLHVDLPNNYVLSLAAPPLTPPPPFPTPSVPTPSSRAVTGGSSPDKFLIFAEEGSTPSPIVTSPSTLDHVLIEDCSDEDDYDEDEVDYSASRGSSKFFRSPVPLSTGPNLDAPRNSVSRVSPLSGSRQSVVPAAIYLKKGLSPVLAPQPTSPAGHNLPTVVSSPIEAPPSGTSHSPAPVEK